MTQVEEYIAQFSDKTIAVSVHDLETGKEIHINADESFHPASTFKVHVMMEVFRQANGRIIFAGRRTPDHQFVYQHRGWKQIFAGCKR